MLLAVLALLLFGAFAGGRAASSHADDSGVASPPPATVVVGSGDSLWSVARRVAPDRDPRELVAQIRRLNHLATPALQVGQQLIVPAAV